VTLTGTQALFTTGTTSIEIVNAVVTFVSLPTSILATAANDPFYVHSGVMNAAGTGIAQSQSVSPAGAIHVLLKSSNVAAGRLVTLAESGAQVTVDIQPNSDTSPTTKALGGVELDPQAAGTTVVSSEVNGFNNIWVGASASVVIN
jgi:hypothetical protein